MNYEKKIRIAELQYIENQSGSKENEQDKISIMTKDYLVELTDLFRNKLIKKGINQSKKFSWEKTAEKTLDLYEKVLNEKYRQ